MGRGTDHWRQLTAIIVAWLFALQLVLSALASIAAFSNYQVDQAAGFTACHHDGASGGDQPATPVPSVPCNHCPLCVGTSSAVAVAIVVALIAVVYVSRLRWVPTGVAFSEPPILASARPRGPPLRA